MNTKAFALLIVATAAAAMCACKKSETEERWAEEEAKLAAWIAENKPDATLINGFYLEKTGNLYPDSMKPEAGDHVLLDYECRYLYDNTVLEYTSNPNWENLGARNPATFKDGGPELWAFDWMGVNQLHKGEQANVYVPSRLLELQDFTTRVFSIQLHKVIDTDLKAYQEKLMSAYMQCYRKDIDTITWTNNGKDYYAMWHTTQKGAGQPAGNGAVSTHTTEKYTLQQGDVRTCFSDRAIRWNDGSSRFSTQFAPMFANLNKGSKIIVAMHYRMMFGEEPYSENNQVLAPSNSVLIYEITIDN